MTYLLAQLPKRAAGIIPADPLMMPVVIYIFGSGLAFFVGVGLILTAVLLTAQTRWKSLSRFSPVTAIVGGMLVTVSGTPLPYWLYGAAAVLTLTWMAVESWQAKLSRKLVLAARIAAASVWLAALAIEIPYHLTPPIPEGSSPALWIIGDSVTAGVNDPKVQTWPRLLATRHGLPIHDMSHVGGTVGSALRRLEKEPLGDGVVLLQIGGNDLLGSTTTADYEEQLDRLLSAVCKPGRTVLMFELPLPPFRNDYGIAQRRLAAKYGVLLIPKRVFVEVLTAGEATLDSVHLTQRGQDLMAELVWGIVAPAFGK